MKCIVVYYSRDGNTKKVAGAIAKTLGCDSEELIDKKNRHGFFGYILASYDAVMKKTADIERTKRNPSKYDVIILGTPVWGMTLAPAIRAYLVKNKKKLKKAAFFATQGGSGAEKAFAEMEKLSKKPLGVLTVLTREVKAGSYQDKVKGFVKKIN